MCLSVPGKIIEIVSENLISRTAKVSFGGVIKEINITFVPESRIGDYVLVHAGVAINSINEEEAEESLKLLEEISLDTGN